MLAPACLKGISLLMAIKSLLNNHVQQLTVFKSCCLAHFGEHADGGKAWHGVDFVEVELATVLV